MMNFMGYGSGMMGNWAGAGAGGFYLGAIFGFVTWILVLALLVMGIVALAKYIRNDKEKK